MKCVDYPKAEKLVSRHVLLSNVEPVVFAPQEITLPSVLVLQDCSPVIPMAKVALKSIAWKMTIALPINTATDFPILAWMSAKRAFVETKLYAQ